MAWGRSNDPAYRFAKAAAKAFNAPEWDDAVAFIAAIPLEDAEQADKAVSLLKASAKEAEGHRAYVLGHLGADRLAAHCARGALDWDEALLALSAHAGRAELASFMARGAGKFAQDDLDGALREAVRLRRLQDRAAYSDRYFNYTAGGQEDAAALLIEKGARAGGDNADLLMAAIEQNKPGLVKLLVENGQDLAVTGPNALKKAEYHGYNQIIFYLREKMMARDRFTAPDAQTLVETKPLDAQGSRLRLVFNFETRRVTEIYDSATGRDAAAMTSHSFDDYDPDSLKSAFERLAQLGGHPKPLSGHKPASILSVDKPKV